MGNQLWIAADVSGTELREPMSYHPKFGLRLVKESRLLTLFFVEKLMKSSNFCFLCFFLQLRAVAHLSGHVMLSSRSDSYYESVFLVPIVMKNVFFIQTRHKLCDLNPLSAEELLLSQLNVLWKHLSPHSFIRNLSYNTFLCEALETRFEILFSPNEVKALLRSGFCSSSSGLWSLIRFKSLKWSSMHGSLVLKQFWQRWQFWGRLTFYLVPLQQTKVKMHVYCVLKVHRSLRHVHVPCCNQGGNLRHKSLSIISIFEALMQIPFLMRELTCVYRWGRSDPICSCLLSTSGAQ